MFMICDYSYFQITPIRPVHSLIIEYVGFSCVSSVGPDDLVLTLLINIEY